MNKQILQISATIEKIETRSDNTLKVSVGTQEMNSEDEALLIKLRNKLGYFIFKETRIKPDELNLPKTIPSIKGEKSPSQLMRAIIYRIWEQGHQNIDKEKFYKDYMGKLNDMLKEKLNG